MLQSQRHSFLTPRRLQSHVIVLAVTVWIVAAISNATPTRRMRTGQVKGTDFVHFYTLASLGAAGRGDRFADVAAQRQVQLHLVPESFSDFFPPAYGPQVTLLLTPLGHLSYEQALYMWLMISASCYIGLIGVVLRRARRLQAYRSIVLIAAIGHPGFWNLIIHGQLSIIAVGAVVAAWAALQANHPTLSGVALGILAYKPPLLLPILVILVVAGDWRSLIGALSMGAGQLVISAVFIGWNALIAYGWLLLDSPRLAAILMSKPEQMHSLRAFWVMIVPNPPAAGALYGLSAFAVLGMAAIVWRKATDSSLRMAALIVAMVLAAPHLYVYDCVVLAPVWIWLTEWYIGRTDLPAGLGRVLYVGYFAALLTVVTRVTHIQVSVLCSTALLWYLYRFAESFEGGRHSEAIGKESSTGAIELPHAERAGAHNGDAERFACRALLGRLCYRRGFAAHGQRS